RSPEALPRQRPVDVVLEPVAETAVAYRLRHPMYGLVELDHPVLVVRGANVPGVLGVIDDRVAGAPAEGIIVPGRLSPKHETKLFQDADERLVRILEKHPRHRSYFRQEVAVLAYRVHDRQAVGLSQGEIVHAVGRRRMHDPRAIFGADETRRQDAEGALMVHLQEIKRP